MNSFSQTAPVICIIKAVDTAGGGEAGRRKHRDEEVMQLRVGNTAQKGCCHIY